MDRRSTNSGSPFEARIGFARAVRVGSIIHVSGTAPVAADGQVVAPGDAYAQARYVLEIIERALEQLGARLDDVVRTRIYVTDISQWEAVGRAHHEFFGTIRPAATMVQVTALIDPAMLVEIEADAILATP